MQQMSEPFEPSDTPRLITPAELGILVKFCRTMRSLSQEALAAEAGITVRTLQRVEAGQPSDLQTRRSLARAFGAEDFDAFNKPSEFLSLDQIAEKRRREDEEKTQNFRELVETLATGELLISEAAQAGAFSCGKASNVEIPKRAQRTAAALEDYIRDAVDIADEIGALGRLDMAEELDGLLRELATMGVSVVFAGEDAEYRFAGGSPIKLTVLHLALCQRGNEPKKLLVAKQFAASR